MDYYLNMKQAITFLFLLVAVVVNGQSYEGTLVYKTEYVFQLSEKMKQMGITEEMLKERMEKGDPLPDSVRTIYKQGDYVSYSNFTPASWSVYKSKENKLYTFQEGDASDLCTVTDVSVDLEEQMTGNKTVIQKLDTLVDFNGMKCEVVRVKWKTGNYDYYYNDSFLKVDCRLFQNHVYDGWADYLKIAGALPVKIVKTTKGLATVTFSLIRQTEGPIDANLFEIPKLVKDEELNIIKVPNREIMRIEK
jgi:hypothetical protein